GIRWGAPPARRGAGAGCAGAGARARSGVGGEEPLYFLCIISRPRRVNRPGGGRPLTEGERLPYTPRMRTPCAGRAGGNDSGRGMTMARRSWTVGALGGLVLGALALGASATAQTAPPGGSRAPQPGRVYRVGYSQIVDHPALN